MLAHLPSPQVQNLRRKRQPAAAVSTPSQAHLPLADQRVGQRLAVAGAEGLKPQPSGVGRAVPLLRRYFGMLEPFALNDRHLPPVAVEPDVPRDVSWRSAARSAALQSVEAVVERIVNLPDRKSVV